MARPRRRRQRRAARRCHSTTRRAPSRAHAASAGTRRPPAPTRGCWAWPLAPRRHASRTTRPRWARRRRRGTRPQSRGASQARGGGGWAMPGRRWGRRGAAGERPESRRRSSCWCRAGRGWRWRRWHRVALTARFRTNRSSRRSPRSVLATILHSSLLRCIRVARRQSFSPPPVRTAQESHAHARA